MYKDRILRFLLASRTGLLSGEELANKLGISRTMIWKHIKSLESEGFGIEAVPSQGYRITSVPDILLIEDVRRGLKTRIIGREMEFLPTTASTNTIAMEMASKGAPEGMVVTAETQTGGKGRLGRKWISPKGNLYISVILRPLIPPHKAPLITLMGAVAVASAVRNACKQPASIKWPNDIMISGKKFSGLLTEMSAEPDRVKHIVLGIGLDVNMDIAELPAELRPIVTTLASETGSRIDRTELLREILRELDKWYQLFLGNDKEVIKAWESLNATTGCRVAISGLASTFEGVAEGIDTEGRLIVRLDEGAMHTVAAGDVTILKRSVEH